MFGPNGNDADHQGMTMAKQPPAVEMTKDQQEIETLATGLAEDIRTKDGTLNKKGQLETKVEYVGVVYRGDDGKLHVTQLYTSNDTSRAPLGDAIKEAGGADRVVAVVHNHPQAHVEKLARADPTVSESDQRKGNMLPSEGDWNIAEQQFKKRTDVTYYLLTPDDKLLKYPYAEHAKWDREREGNPLQKARGNYDPDFGQEVELPSKRPARQETPKPDQASPQSQTLYAQAMSNQLPSMQAYPDETRQQMAAFAATVAVKNSWDGISGIGMNNATATQRAGDLLCIAGKSNNPVSACERCCGTTRSSDESDAGRMAGPSGYDARDSHAGAGANAAIGADARAIAIDGTRDGASAGFVRTAALRTVRAAVSLV